MAWGVRIACQEDVREDDVRAGKASHQINENHYPHIGCDKIDG